MTVPLLNFSLLILRQSFFFSIYPLSKPVKEGRHPASATSPKFHSSPFHITNVLHFVKSCNKEFSCASDHTHTTRGGHFFNVKYENNFWETGDSRGQGLITRFLSPCQTNSISTKKYYFSFWLNSPLQHPIAYPTAVMWVLVQGKVAAHRSGEEKYQKKKISLI